jgi:hypothetical protein
VVEIVDGKHELTENQKQHAELFYDYTLWRGAHKVKSEETKKADYTNITLSSHKFVANISI